MPGGSFSLSERSSTDLDSCRTSSTFTSAWRRVLWRSLTSSLTAFSSTFGTRSSFRTASVRDRPTASILFFQYAIPLLNPVQNCSNNQWETDSGISVNVYESSSLSDLPPTYRLGKRGTAESTWFRTVGGYLDGPIDAFAQDARKKCMVFRKPAPQDNHADLVGFHRHLHYFCDVGDGIQLQNLGLGETPQAKPQYRVQETRREYLHFLPCCLVENRVLVVEHQPEPCEQV